MASPGSVTINLGKLESLRGELGKQYYAKVGILSNSSHAAEEPNGEPIDMVTLGTIHEFGSLSRNIPARSFLRMPLVEKKKELVKSLGNKKTKEMIEDGNIKGVFALIGIQAEAIVQQAFASGGFGKWPRLKPATIKAKKSDALLIDTGALRRSITSAVVKR